VPIFPIEFQLFWVSGGPKLKQKSIKNQKNNDLNMGRHLGIVFLTILMDFDGFRQAIWEGKSNQDRSKKATKKL